MIVEPITDDLISRLEIFCREANELGYTNNASLKAMKFDWCKENGESVTCFKENTYHSAWKAENVPKQIETKRLMRDVSECAVVKF